MAVGLLWTATAPAVGLAAKPSGKSSRNAATLTSIRIKDVPHVRQKPDFCGEACVEMWLKKLKYDIDQDAVFNVSGVNPALGRGCHTIDMARAMRNLGFEPGSVRYQIDANSTSHLERKFVELHSDLKKGIPSIVCMKTGLTSSATEHFRLILGYDQASDEVIYHEPADDKGSYHRMKRSRFMACWPLRYNKRKWTLVRLRLDLEKIKKPAEVESFSNADFAQHVRELRAERLPEKGFTVVIEKPFVVIGDESADTVKRRAVGTVRWSVRKLKAQYFKKDPEKIMDIWLFKDAKSYRSHAKSIFNDTPTTPYGYASTEHNALIMNIRTGGGTLVHEIVHPYIAVNFPDCPSWLNEGLGSLYEQSRDHKGKIYGSTNWRLAGLQKAIKSKELPSFKDLTSTTEFGFYNMDRGTNYAQSRYLCYYLQEKGLLPAFYHSFVKHHKQDKTGYKTLKKILTTDDMDAFKKHWEDYVMDLRFS